MYNSWDLLKPIIFSYESYYFPKVVLIKLLVLTTTFPIRKDDSTPAFVYELSKRLVDEGFDTYVLAPHSQGAKKFEVLDGMKIYRFPYFFPLKYQKLVDGSGILPNLKKTNLAKIQLPFLFLCQLYYSMKIIKRENIDVVHSHWIVSSGLVGAICKKVFGTKHLLTEHAAGLVALNKFPFKRPLAGFILRNCDSISVVSSYVYDRLLEFVPLKILNDTKRKLEIIPMRIDTKHFKVNKDKNELKAKYKIQSKNVLLFIGRLAEKKGVIYLIDALPQIISKAPDAVLIICGNGPLKNDCEMLVKKIGMNSFVKFTGHISDKEEIDYLSMADLLIVPSIVTHDGDTEGLPVVILEGLSMGKPIIASDVGGIKDVIKNGINGFLIEEKNSNSIAVYVTKVLSSEELMSKLSKSAISIANEYDWKIIGNKYGKILHL